MNAAMEQALAVLRNDEGRREHPYDDATGKRVHAPKGILTVGVGINLEEGLDDEEMDWLERHRLEREVGALVPALHQEHRVYLYLLPGPAQLALMLACFQLGAPRLMKFHRMLDAVSRGDWRAAGAEAVDSAWARETASRAEEVAALFRQCIGEAGGA